MKAVLTFAIIFFIASCSSSHLRYRAKYNTTEGKTGIVTYEHTYGVAPIYSQLCIVTGIFWGGACWYYLAMPTVNQTEVLENDLKPLLNKELGAQVSTLEIIDVAVKSWSVQKDYLNIQRSE
jgi:hypothetical protein